jgi:hypothetical protein
VCANFLIDQRVWSSIRRLAPRAAKTMVGWASTERHGAQIAKLAVSQPKRCSGYECRVSR